MPKPPVTDEPPTPGHAPSIGLCPHWCITRHGVQQGEEDWVHLGESLHIAEGFSVRLCMSVDPQTGHQDGPYVLLGSTELTLPQAAALGATLVELPL